MAVQIYCPECKSCASVSAKKCPKCGAIFPKDGKKFRVDVTVKGKRFTRFAPNLTVAREMETTIRTEMLREEFDITAHKPKSKAVTLGDVWTRFLEWGKEHKKTWRCDQYNYETHLGPRFDGKALRDITALDVERLKIEMKRSVNRHGKPYTLATIKHQLVLLGRLFSLAHRWGLFDGENPLDRVEIPKLDNKVTEFLTGEEAERLQSVLDSWPCRATASFVRFAMLTGFRRGELFKLAWDDVDFERGMVTLQKPKGGVTQTVPVSSAALSVLRDLPVTSRFVFPGRDGKERTDFKGPWQTIRKAAELPSGFRFHGLRHNFASALVSSGVDLSVVQGLLTHKDARTTSRYAHLRPDALKQAANLSAEMIVPKKANVIPLAGRKEN